MNDTTNIDDEGSARLDDRVIFITGLARGQGRSHAIHAARLGASIIGIDAVDEVEQYSNDLSTEADLNETIRLVEDIGRPIVAMRADVRDLASLDHAVEVGLREFGRLDGVIANAGVVGKALPSWEAEDAMFVDVIQTNLIGVWRTVRATVPSMLAQDTGGAIAFISSGASLRAQPNIAAYTAAKTGLLGLMRAMALELAPHRIRVNSVSPGSTNTPMFNSQAMRKLFVPDGELTDEAFEQRARALNAMPVPYMETTDISRGVMYLLSDAARYVTGTNLVIDGGYSLL